MSTTGAHDGSPAMTDVKWADTVPGVHDLFRQRWSPRAFSDRPVEKRDLKAMLDAARWATSSFNEQPWRFIVGTRDDPAAYEKLLGLLAPFNQEWVKAAPVLIITAGKQTFSHNNAPNYYGLHDAGQALAHLMLQATALGLYAHAMGGFDQDKARKELNIPSDYAVGAMVAIGYQGSPDQLNERYRTAELGKRARKPLSELAFSGTWNHPIDL